jgi:hypothetical protein
MKSASPHITWPASPAGLRELGYTQSNRTRCSAPACNREIEWWITPAKRRMPLEHDPQTGLLLPHWATCPEARQFRRAK